MHSFPPASKTMKNEQALTKEGILDAAEGVLRRFGPEKSSVVDVARALQVSHGTIYRHFPSKSALREAVTERWLRGISDPLKAIADEQEGSAVERLRRWFLTLAQSKRTYSVDDPEMFAMYTAVTLETMDVIATHVEVLQKQITAIIESGMANKEIKSGDPRVMANGLFLALSSFHHPAFAFEWTEPEVGQDFEEVWKLLVNGIAHQ